MQRQLREEPPQILRENWELWGNRYRENRLSNPRFNFQWPKLNGESLNQTILPLLLTQTQQHCSYCDAYRRRGEFTIDHFRPKSIPEFYDRVCQWENLFVACTFCQKVKREQFDPLLLKPDEPDYHFENYFLYNFTEHKLYPRADISELEISRVLKTIEILGLNHTDNIKARAKAYQIFVNSELDTNDKDFRFMF